MKVDLLAFGAHPDDVEMSCGGIILSFTQKGKKAAIVDFTRGEMGTRGTPELRLDEAKEAASILGLSERHNLAFKDVFFSDDNFHLEALVREIRYFQPEIILANAPDDRHPDHPKAALMIEKACFLSGLRKFKTQWEGMDQAIWRPKTQMNYIQDKELRPSFVVDVTPYWEKRNEAIKAYKSQFFNPESKEPESYISGEIFWNFLEARARTLGHTIGVEFGEGLINQRMVGLSDLSHII